MTFGDLVNAHVLNEYTTEVCLKYINDDYKFYEGKYSDIPLGVYTLNGNRRIAEMKTIEGGKFQIILDERIEKGESE